MSILIIASAALVVEVTTDMSVITSDSRPLVSKRDSVPEAVMALLTGLLPSLPDSPANLKQCPSNRMAV